MCAESRLIKISGQAMLALAVLISWASSAQAHGIAGNRYFPATLTFDDPAVEDELTLPLNSRFEHPTDEGGEAKDDSYTAAFLKLVAPTLAVGGDTTWTDRKRSGFSTREGFTSTHVLVKSLLYENDPHETLIAGSLIAGIGGLGSKGVGGGGPFSIQPSVTFGKGFGDLPDQLRWLRPFAIAGAISPEFPINGRTRSLIFDPAKDQSQYGYVHNYDVLHWAFAIEFSTFYLTSRYDGGPPKEEPLHQLVPLIEFPVDTTFSGGKATSAATMNPGFAYVGEVYQVAAEAIVPLNSQGGRGVGMTMSLEFFLDDLMPSVFGEPSRDKSLVTFERR